MQVMLNPSPFNEKLKDINYGMLTYLILNEVEAAEISGCEDVEDIVEFFRNTYPSLKVMLTLGKRGCVYFDADNRAVHPAFCVKAVDTTAAGDTFTGYFISGIARGESMENILRIASAASAVAVSKMGAAPSIPQRAEVLEFLKHVDCGGML
jgi:ribokinase